MLHKGYIVPKHAYFYVYFLRSATAGSRWNNTTQKKLDHATPNKLGQRRNFRAYTCIEIDRKEIESGREIWGREKAIERPTDKHGTRERQLPLSFWFVLYSQLTVANPSCQPVMLWDFSTPSVSPSDATHEQAWLQVITRKLTVKSQLEE